MFVGPADWESLGAGQKRVHRLRTTMAQLHRRLGLLHCGIDFAVGTVGGVFGDPVMNAVQDINPKSTGALFLREFMARHPGIGAGAATRVLCPDATEKCRTDPRVGLGILDRPTPCEEVAVVPGRLGDDRDVGGHLTVGPALRR